LRPAAAATGVAHERMGSPSTCTVHAPHWAMPQPYFVPVNPRSSRNTQSKGVSGSASTSLFRPLTFSMIGIRALLKEIDGASMLAAHETWRT
jgi:hypothetical protein